MHWVPPLVAATLLLASCDPSETGTSKAADSQAPAPPASAPPTLEVTFDGHAWAASSIRYHVDQAFDAKEYGHTFEARAADGSRLDLIILCAELTLSPRSYPSAHAEEVTVTYTPAGRAAGSYAGDSSRDATVTVTSERSATSVQGKLSATLQDLDPNGRALRLEGTFGSIPRAKP